MMRNKGKKDAPGCPGASSRSMARKSCKETTKPAEYLHEHRNKVSIETGSEEIENKQYAKDAHDGGERIL